MISPSTPPGTKIVCINTDLFRFVHESWQFVERSGDLVLGAEYTLVEIVPFGYKPVLSPSLVRTGHFCAIVAEIKCTDTFGQPAGYFTHRFRRRDLPESLTRLQTALLKPAPALG